MTAAYFWHFYLFTKPEILTVVVELSLRCYISMTSLASLKHYIIHFTYPYVIIYHMLCFTRVHAIYSDRALRSDNTVVR